MKYAVGCAFNLKEICENFPYKKLKINCKLAEEVFGDPHRQRLVRRVFKTCFKLVINDIIKRNATFWLPLTGKVKANLHMLRFYGKKFQQLRKGGKWKDVDFLKSNFQGYQIGLYMYGNRVTRIKPVHLNPELTKKITDNTNDGKNYGDGALDTNLNTYLKSIYAYYPDIPEQDIDRILKFCWKSLYLHNSYGGDTFIVDYDIWCYIGHLTKDSIKHYLYYIKKLSLKLRVLYRRRKIPWDGYYYFALSSNQYENYKSQINTKGRKRKHFKFGNVIMYLILDDCKISEYKYKYIFRIKMDYPISIKFLKRDLVTDKAELIITREPLKFKDILVTENNYELL